MKRIFVSFLAFVLMTPIAWAAEITVPKPSGNLNLQVGHPSTISLYDVPTQLTHERLNKQGSKAWSSPAPISIPKRLPKEQYNSRSAKSWILYVLSKGAAS